MAIGWQEWALTMAGGALSIWEYATRSELKDVKDALQRGIEKC